MDEKVFVEDICHKIATKKSFAYKIENTYFLTNGNIARKCNIEEIKYFDLYLKECDYLDIGGREHERRYEVEIDKLKKLSESMSFLLKVSENLTENNVCYKLDEFLKNFHPAKWHELLKQIELFEKACFYKSRYDVFSKS